VNRLELFLQYAQKVFELNELLSRVRDGRCDPKIPVLPVILCLLLGVVLRISSYHDLSAQTQRRRWRHLCRLKNPIGDDIFGYVTERMQPQDWRQIQARMVKRLKHNKALESCKIKGLLFVSLDANEHFKSRSRHCVCCCQRQIEVVDGEGKTKKVTEYYHRYVFAQINGPKINIVMDVEPIRPGEDECAAALRLLGRLRRIYGPRFFDAITADAWYARGPFLKSVLKMGWQWVAVLKRQDMNVYQEAQQLSQGQKPCASFEDVRRDRQVQLWDVKDLDFSDEYGQKVRTVRSEERWIQKQISGGIKEQKPQCSQWLWAASDGLNGYAPELIYDAGHRRWGIENKAFNELTQGYHLEHCYHHDPTAMLVQMLILVFGFTLFTAFALHCQWVRTGKQTLKSLAHDLDLALEEDRNWDQWFHCG
jgi:Transposase DDE domain